MKTTIAIVVAAFIALAIAGGYFYPQIPSLFGSAAGTTYNDAKFAGTVVNLALPGANATSSSIYNGDAGNRYVSDYKLGCTGLGTSYTAYTGAALAALTLTIGTTSTAAPAVIPSSNVVASAVTVATTTASNAIFTSSTGGGLANVWGPGTYMTFWFNATNTAACTVGVSYFGS